jgi:Kdo2-lipid IVA lauroyltransferase/acyltransferase
VAKKKPYRFVLYLLLRGVCGLIYILPRRVAMALARGAGYLSYVFVLRQKNKTLQHLNLVFGGEKSPAEIKRLAIGVFENLIQTGAEILQFTKLTPAKLDKIVDAGEAFKTYDRVLACNKGLISVTAHIGNWELLAGVFGMKGYKGGVLARRIYYEPYNRWIVGLRESLKVPTIYRDDSSRTILKLLAKNQIVGLLPDQDVESLKGIFVPFFGKPAYTPVAPARLSISSGAPIVPNFLIRMPGDRYKIVMGEVIRPEGYATREEAVRKMTEAWMKQFEKVIREYPEQWAWMHNRWKTTPEILEAKTKKETAVNS